MIPLSREKFQDALKKGLGRAVQHVRASRPEEVRDDLLNACLNNLVHDSQLEYSRAPWLFEMIEMTGEDKFYRSQIYDKWWDDTQENVSWQLFYILCEYGKRGDPSAIKEIYWVFDRCISDDEHEGYPTGLEEIVEIDGIPGLIYVLDKMGARILREKEIPLSPYTVENAEKRFGQTEVQNALAVESARNPNIAAYLAHPESQKYYWQECKNETDEERGERLRKEFPLRKMIDDFLNEDFSQYESDPEFIENRISFFGGKARTLE